MERATLSAYVTGFAFSLLLTLDAYFLVSKHLLTGIPLVAAVAGLAVVQLLVQLICFLHLGDEPRPRWNLMALLFALMVVFIIVFGSIWIMYHLNYNMTPSQTNTYIQQEEGISR